MSYSVNPLNFKSTQIRTVPQQQTFLAQLGQLLSEIIVNLGSSTFLAGVLNSTAALFSGSLLYKAVNLGVVTGSQSVDCANAAGASISFSTTTVATVTLNLLHLSLAVPVTIIFTNSSGSNVALVINATQPGGTAYTAVFWKTGSALVNMTSTGLTVTAQTVIAVGSSNPTGTWELVMVAN